MSFFSAAVFEDYLDHETTASTPDQRKPATTRPEKPRDYQIHVTARRVNKDSADRIPDLQARQQYSEH